MSQNNTLFFEFMIDHKTSYSKLIYPLKFSRWWEGLRRTTSSRAFQKRSNRRVRRRVGRHKVFQSWWFCLGQMTLSSKNQVVTETEVQMKKTNVNESRRYRMTSVTKSLKDQRVLTHCRPPSWMRKILFRSKYGTSEPCGCQVWV